MPLDPSVPGLALRSLPAGGGAFDVAGIWSRLQEERRAQQAAEEERADRQARYAGEADERNLRRQQLGLQVQGLQQATADATRTREAQSAAQAVVAGFKSKDPKAIEAALAQSGLNPEAQRFAYDLVLKNLQTQQQIEKLRWDQRKENAKFVRASGYSTTLADPLFDMDDQSEAAAQHKAEVMQDPAKFKQYIDALATYGDAPPNPQLIQTGDQQQFVTPTPGQAFPRANPAPHPPVLVQSGNEQRFVTPEVGASFPRAAPAPTPPVQPTVVQGPSGPMLVDKSTNSATPILGPDGQPVLAPATAGQRDAASGFEKAAPIIKALDELSAKINTGQGLIARITGAAEKAQAQANYNDDVAEYQSVVSGFTPLVARALGHTGVLTEPDVQSVKALFPQPGDSKTLRDRKMARLQVIMSGVAAATPGAKAPAAADEAASGEIPDLRGLTPGKGRTFNQGPFQGQTWTIGLDGKPRRVS